MRKIFFIFIFMIICAATSEVYAYEGDKVSEKELVEIYIIALDSFASEAYLEEKSYIAIDMETSFFEGISCESKEEIVGFFKDKYELEALNASFEKLKKIGLVSDKLESLKANGKRGVILIMDGVEFISNKEVEITGFWFVSGVGAEYYKDTIISEDGKWILKEKKITGFS